MRTEELLQELKRSNAELEAQAGELNEKAKLLEIKNQEVETGIEKRRRKSRAVAAYFQVQIRVLGEHVA